jgi:hypothetical protein
MQECPTGENTTELALNKQRKTTKYVCHNGCCSVIRLGPLPQHGGHVTGTPLPPTDISTSTVAPTYSDKWHLCILHVLCFYN